MKLILMIGLMLSPSLALACEALFTGETEAALAESDLPLARLEHAVAKYVPQFDGHESSGLTWTFFPRGRRMAIQVHTVIAQSRFVDVGHLKTVVLGDDGTVLWQTQSGEAPPHPVSAARIPAATAKALIDRAYSVVRDREPTAREVWELLQHLLPEHDVDPFGQLADP